MKKRLLCIVLIFAMVCAVLPQYTLPAKAATSGSCGEELTWSFDPGTGTLTISGYGYMDDFDDRYIFDDDGRLIDQIVTIPWKDYSGQITSVQLPEGLRGIGIKAFQDCTQLRSINIPSNVHYIGMMAFIWCSSLQSVVIPEGVTEINSATFFGCTSLQNVTIPSSVTEIGSEAFRECKSLTSVSLPAGLRTIGNSAFRYCDKLEIYSLPDGLEKLGGFALLNTVYYNNPNNWDNGLLYLGKWAMEAMNGIVSANIRPGTVHIADDLFNGKHSLEYVTIPDSVESIGESAFIGCELLTNVKIPGSVKRIGFGAFDWTGYYNNMNHWLNGLLYLDNWLISVNYETSYEMTSVNVRPGTKGIADELFSFHDKLTSVTLPEGLRYIGEETFYFCWGLRNISIPGSVESIGRSAFCDCTSMNNIVIPNGIKRIEDYAFAWCESFTELTIPAGVTSIGEAAFVGCSNVARFVVPESVTSIGSYAFDGWIEIPRSILILNRNCTFADEYGGLGPIDNTVLYGYPGSTTENHAWKSGYQFRSIEETDFIDVAGDAYYAEPVKWAVENGVTNGTSPYIFKPDSTCTRAQVVTFLWRAKGEPEPAGSANPFTDVPDAQYFTKPVLWAVENKITSGTSETTFSPGSGCTRGQVVTFLWRAAGQPEPASANNPFTDVKPDAYYYKAVLWAVEQGITNGTSADKFSPDSTCTRGQIVTFLYRDLAD